MRKLKFTLPLCFRQGCMAKKSVRLLIEVIGSVMTLLILVVLVLLGRLSLGPINLDFLTADVESALNAPALGIKASIQHTQLVWREWERPFEIELLNLHVQKDQDAEWLKIEHVGVSLQLHRLLRGEVALKHIRIHHPHILLPQ